jgi:ectoine hydroxylase-related dioxygenase (phytanoyl-CoA dioxygenase family)
MPGAHNSKGVYAGPLRPYLGFDGVIEARTGVRGEDIPSWPVPTNPGDLLCWDYRLMHASYGSTAKRRQISLNFRGGSIDHTIVGGYDLDLDA